MASSSGGGVNDPHDTVWKERGAENPKWKRTRCSVLLVANSNNTLEILNVVLATLSLGVVVVAAWLGTRTVRDDCLSFLHWPFIIIGLLLFCFCIFGFWASSRRNRKVLLLYSLLLFLLILVFAAFTIFALVVTTQRGNGTHVLAIVAGGERIPATFREYTPSQFSTWLQSRVSGSHWDNIRSCLSRSGSLCASLNDKYTTIRELYRARGIAATQVGCCKPPSSCGFKFVNATTWSVPASRQGALVGDCALWSNNSLQLCFSCESCKAGELHAVRQHWLKVATVAVVVLCLLVALLVAACFTLRHISHQAVPDEPKPINPFL